MWKSFLTLAKGPFVVLLPYLCYGILIAGAYWLGGHVQRTQDTAVKTAVDSVAGQLQKQMADLTNGTVSNINQRVSEGINDAVAAHQLTQTRIDHERDSFSLSPDAGVLVQGPVSASTQTCTAGSDPHRPGGNGTEYRAKLSTTAEAFLRGEAYRADLAANDLQLTKTTIREWSKAVDDYNRTVADTAKLPRVKLPVDMSGTAYEKK